MWIFFRFGVNLTLEYASEHILNWSPSLEIARVAAGKVSAVKNTLVCMAGLTLNLISVAAAGLLVVIQ